MSHDSGHFSMLELFQTEVASQTANLRQGLQQLETDPADADTLEALMRAAHSVKGAARIVDLEPAVQLAHVMEDLFVTVQGGKQRLEPGDIETLQQATDLLREFSEHADDSDWLHTHRERIHDTVRRLGGETSDDTAATPDTDTKVQRQPTPGENAAIDANMLSLFHGEAQTQLHALNAGLLTLEAEPANADNLDGLMRAAHSLKGAARMVGLEQTVRLAHALEDAFVAAQQGRILFTGSHIDALLQAVDHLSAMCQHSDDDAWFKAQQDSLGQQLQAIEAIIDNTDAAASAPEPSEQDSPARPVQPNGVVELQIDSSLLELFRTEAESQLQSLNNGLLQLEGDGDGGTHEGLMRSAHSLKGAARMVGIDPGVTLAHVMEDIFVATQNGGLQLSSAAVDILLQTTDLLKDMAQSPDIADWYRSHNDTVATFAERLQAILAGKAVSPVQTGQASTEPAAAPAPPPEPGAATATTARSGDNAIRVSSESLNRLMGLAGEVQVEARWLRPFAEGLQHVKQRQSELIGLLDRLRDYMDSPRIDDYGRNLFNDVLRRAGDCRHLLNERLGELEEYDRRNHNLASRLNREVVASRMRPFADGVHGFQRMVRDVSRSLGKEVKFDIRGLDTQVDRDILEKIEAPLNHILRNAVDHGIETPAERSAAGKPAQAHLRLEAMHSAGMLSIIVEDDGRGMDLENLRCKVVDKQLVSAEMARDLTETELMEFIFLPGFSTRSEVTEISGRGVGLDVVHSVVQEMHGLVNAVSHPGRGMRFHMQLPLTLSVMRTLLVQVAGEPYAIPLAQINRTLKLDRSHIQVMEGRQYFTLGNHHIGLVTTNQLLGFSEAPPNEDEACIVVLGERLDRYGFVVDRFLGERTLVVNPLDPRLGKIKDIAACSMLEDGHPCLILDVDDLLRSADLLIAGGRLDQLDKARARQTVKTGKRILVVDDSITVREVERNMLANIGYEVEVAVDGMDGWNAVRVGDYDLIISDIDMPRMNGFEFVSQIKNDPGLKQIPVMIVSYKDREEDRNKGLEVGADYYLTKGSFQDATLIDAVLDLIGEP